MKLLFKKQNLLAAAIAGLLMLGAQVQASSLSIVVPPLKDNDSHTEVVGDPGGSTYPNKPGIPTALGGWPTNPMPNGFAPDPSFGNALGTSGFHGSYLKLNSARTVTFQYLGKGDSTLLNEFWLDLNMDFVIDAGDMKLFDSTTPSCTMAGPTNPVCGSGSSYTAYFSDGYIPFIFKTGLGVELVNDFDGNPNGNPDTSIGVSPGYFLGADPYLAVGKHDQFADVVYAGLTDLPALGDHDFQDFTVRISTVPEPGSISLFALALTGMLWLRKRSAKA